MNNKIEDYRIIAKSLKSHHKQLTEFEAISLAIQIERNQILENGLNVSRSDSHPPAIEALAIAFGFTSKRGSRTITEILSEIVDKKE